MDNVIGIVFAVLLVIFLIILLTRWLWCWYFKINARLHEMEKTNELLQNIFDALIQGNKVNSVTAGQIINMNSSDRQPTATMIRDDDIPDL